MMDAGQSAPTGKLLDALLDVFNCTFDSLPEEIFLNPTYWELTYPGTKAYVQCAVNQNVTFDKLEQCYLHLDKKCPKFYDEFCYKSLQQAREQAKLQPNKTENNPDAFAQYIQQLAEAYGKVKPCIATLKAACDRSSVRAIKTIRLNMIQARKMLEKDPSLKIIHLVRDPRGMFLSRRTAVNDTVLDRQYIFYECKKIKENIKTFQLLVKEFPISLLQIRYEDLATNPYNTALRVYKLINVTSDVAREYYSSWIQRINNLDDNTLGTYGTVRKNSSAVAYSWMKKSSKDRKLIESIPECYDIIKTMNYPNVLNSNISLSTIKIK